jgi:hypothetical protein
MNNEILQVSEKCTLKIKKCDFYIIFSLLLR